MNRVLFTLLLLSLVAPYAWATLKDVTYTGTAFVVDAGGYLLTCAHVVDDGDAEKVTVTLGGKSYEASVLATDNVHDTALLQIQASDLPCLPLANSNLMQVGEEVRVAGFPLNETLGTNIKVTRGTVSGIAAIRTQKTFQIDAAVNPGNSGGPLVNESGEVVGIVNAKISENGVEGVGLAVPINYARGLLRNEFIEGTAATSAGKLDGPALVKQIAPALALVTTMTQEWTEDEDETDGEADEALVRNRIVTRDLSLVDKEGKLRASLWVGEDDAPNFVFWDGARKFRLAIALNKDGIPGISLYDTNGKVRADLGMFSDGRPSLSLSDSNGRQRAGLLVFADGSPCLTLMDANAKERACVEILGDETSLIRFADSNGKDRISVGAHSGGNAWLTLWDAAGKGRAVLRAIKDGSPSLELSDAAEKVRASLVLGKDGTPSLFFRDAVGNPRISLGVLDNLPWIVQFDQNGKIFWRAQ